VEESSSPDAGNDVEWAKTPGGLPLGASLTSNTLAMVSIRAT
jgi:hypothetical protein